MGHACLGLTSEARHWLKKWAGSGSNIGQISPFGPHKGLWTQVLKEMWVQIRRLEPSSLGSIRYSARLQKGEEHDGGIPGAVLLPLSGLLPIASN